MDKSEDLKMDQKIHVSTNMEAEDESWDLLKLA